MLVHLIQSCQSCHNESIYIYIYYIYAWAMSISKQKDGPSQRRISFCKPNHKQTEGTSECVKTTPPLISRMILLSPLTAVIGIAKSALTWRKDSNASNRSM